MISLNRHDTIIIILINGMRANTTRYVHVAIRTTCNTMSTNKNKQTRNNTYNNHNGNTNTTNNKTMTNNDHSGIIIIQHVIITIKTTKYHTRTTHKTINRNKRTNTQKQILRNLITKNE